MDIDWRPGTLVTKDPDSTICEKWNFSDWLRVGETINSATVNASSGLTVDSWSVVDESVEVYLSGGTPGMQYRVTVTPITQTRRDDFSVDYLVAEQ